MVRIFSMADGQQEKKPVAVRAPECGTEHPREKYELALRLQERQVEPERRRQAPPPMPW
ncbi:hypothetical protein [Chitinilyticum piscinae]|uniref:Uncharacterized protein n=1 Tax=Chitinilyticum piscinae TaxID=2866724 RepID=A0A8J7K1S9_9NEIS|nr:hypothetical protein [Chitinilyticum piscinae]MBE9609067.1 hypothetical protein [Chitinilyticum piscinae]